MGALDFSRYRTLSNARGAPWFSLAGWLGRFPRSAMSLSIIIVVAARTDSYQLAGMVSAGFIVAMAVAGPLWSRAMDRRGQGRVLTVSWIATAVASGFLVLVALTDAARFWWFVAAVALGATLADVGAAVRTRWTRLLPPGERGTAFAVETMADESVFVIAPPLVTLVAATLEPVLGVVLAAVAGAVGCALLAAAGSSDPGPRSTSVGRVSWLPPVTIWPVIVSVLGIGAMFGAFDVFSVGWAHEAGHPWVTGSIMATLSLGNTLGAMLLGAVGWQRSLRTRYLLTGLLLAATVVALPFVHGLVGRHLVVFVVGMAVGPVLVSGVALVESRVDHHRVTEMLSWYGLGISAGVPIGSTLGGHALDVSGTGRALTVMTVSGVAVVLLAAAGELALSAGPLRRASRAVAPTAPTPHGPSPSPAPRADDENAPTH